MILQYKKRKVYFMKTKADPTGMARARKRSSKRIEKRLNAAEKEVLALFKQIQKKRRSKTKIVNKEVTIFYDYELTDQDIQQMNNSVQFILNRELLESQTNMPPDWYWKDDIEQPYREGTIEETNLFNQLIIAAGIAGVIIGGFPVAEVPVDQVLSSELYREALNKQYASNYTTFKGLSENTTKQIMQQIELGTQSGETPSFIAGQISDRFDVSRSSADRITNTEINKAYNDAKLQTGVVIAERTGLRAGVIHISALLPTTRAHHAARHGNAYTVVDQTQWWNEGSNRINCYCTTRSVLITKDGKVVDQEFQQEIKAEKKFFD